MPDAWIRQWGDPTLHAATQVGLMRRLFVFRLEPDGDPDVLVNPRVVSAATERATFYEGCLSFRGVTVAVERPAAVRVEWQDLDGHARVLELDDFGASLMQHEIDHLDGILTLDRATPEERRRAVAALLAEPAVRAA